jgi:hypothetical protein
MSFYTKLKKEYNNKEVDLKTFSQKKLISYILF